MQTTGTGEGVPIKRRTLSTASAEDVHHKEQKERSVQPDQPVHKPKDSLLASTMGYTNYRGILNLCVLLLILSNSRVALENLIKYGILVDPIQWIKLFWSRPSQSPSCIIILGVYVLAVISFAVEVALSKRILSENLGQFLAGLNLTLLIVLPAVFVYIKNCHPIGGTFVVSITSVIFLKMVSYHMVNYWCRKEIKSKDKVKRQRSFSVKDITPRTTRSSNSNGATSSTLVTYPDNLNLKDLFYFICVPTLCYELNFPRTNRIRKRFLIKRLIEMVVLILLILALIQQWMIPTITNSLQPFKEMNFSGMLERLLKLAVPNHIIWLIGFYWLFHSTFNAVSEVLRFADRQFYNDWWNAESVNQFWKDWNIPVHRWCVRHVYKPMLRHKWDKFWAGFVVFLISALFHEYLISIPLNMFRTWSFFGMFSQVPFAIFVSKYLHHPIYANIAVWISLILGQPLCILMYYHDYYVINYSQIAS